MKKRKQTKEIIIGNIKVGNNNPIVVQSMTNTQTTNIDATVSQILRLEEAGCEIVRVSTPTLESAKALKKIKENVTIPIIADIHFNYKIAIEAIENGADAIRINPGNIDKVDKVKEIVSCAKINNIPIRVGVNAGSLQKDLIKKYKGVTSDALVESCLQNIRLIENFGFNDLKVSLKASDINLTIDSYKKISNIIDYPLHIGITEAGTIKSGVVKSSVGIGILLYEGIGDTIRVSLSGDPVEEVYVAYQILNSLNIRKRGIEIISCPTCARTEFDISETAMFIENNLKHIRVPLKVAVMGCVVNGPGEAREADIGIAGGKKYSVLFKKGKIIKKIRNSEIKNILMEEIKKLI